MSVAPCTVRIAADEMAAWLDFATDMPCPVEELQMVLARAGVQHGIDTFLLHDLAIAHQAGRSYCVAQGTLPTAALRYTFPRMPQSTPKRLPNGQVDFYNLGTIPNVRQQQVLVARVPRAERRPGQRVTGQAILAADQDESLPLPGANVALSAAGEALIALCHGYAMLRDGVLSVEATYTIEGDVDFSVGNVVCVGDLIVMGDVQSGFSIQSEQQLTVYGVVEQASLAALGSVTLYGNVFGNSKARITSGASVHGAYIDAVAVEARRDIILRQGARHSHLQAGGSIVVQNDTGHLLGGSAQACERIVTHNIGSASRVPTHIEILPSIYDADKAPVVLDHLRAMLADDEQTMAQPQPDAACAAADYVAFRATLEQCQAAVTRLENYLQVRRRVVPDIPGLRGAVVATGTVYPGVTICIGGVSLPITQPLSNVVFYKAGQTIHNRLSPYQEA
ncbi:MAG: DUF342 domain-containing protein [Candidatus Tectimicrobiota bacterium]